MSNPILLLDASAFLYRSYYALPPLTTSKGQPTSVIKGVLNMLQNLLKTYPNSEIAVVFDAKGKSFRNQMFADYKANRPPMPDDLKQQIAPLFEIIKSLGLNLISIEGIEADDTIGTLAKKFSDQGLENLIVSSDKDMAQLVSEKSKILDPVKNVILDTQAVIKKFELAPNQIVDWLALMGDKADNIPGVEGVGNKTAVALLQQMQNIDNIYANLDKIETLKIRGAKSLKQKLINCKETLILSKQLATIKTDCELNIEKQDLIKQPTKVLELKHQMQDLEFNLLSYKFLLDLDADSGSELDINSSANPNTNSLTNANANADLADSADAQATQQNTNSSIEELLINPAELEQQTLAFKTEERNYATILTQTDLDAFLTKLSAIRVFALDTETTSLNYMQADLVGMSFCFATGEAYYLPFKHSYLGAPTQLNKTETLAKLKPILENPKQGKIGQNLSFDYKILRNQGIDLEGIISDTLLSSHALNSLGKHDLSSLAHQYLNLSAIDFSEIAGTGKNQLTFDQIEIEKASFYAAEDADFAWRLSGVLEKNLINYPKLQGLLEFVELPLVKILANMELTGVKLDVDLLANLSQDFATRIDKIEKQAYQLAGEEFNLNSPKQLAEILFEKLKLPIIKKTPKGAISTAEEVLQELALDYPLPKLLLEHRSLQKLKNTYTDKLPLLIDSKTKRLHTSYHQVGTATGRLSSTEPNLQNIPIKSEGREIRGAFIAEQGYKILAADYSQIELRIMAHLSGDAGLLNAFRQNLDIHSATAAEVFGLNIEEVSSEQRRSAKAINFGLIYGMGAFGLAKQLQVDRNQASHYIEKYFSRYAGVKAFMERTRVEASERGFVETLAGRRLYLPNINASNKRLKSAAERTAINAPMQGSAADLIKKAMISLDEKIKQSGLDIKMLMQVHDELVFEVAQDQTEAASALIKQAMENAMQLDIPLLVEVGIGNNWQEAH